MAILGLLSHLLRGGVGNATCSLQTWLLPLFQALA